MAATSSFAYTNTTASGLSVATIALGDVSNYALISDEPTECILSNVTTPVDQEEILTYRCKRIPTVNTQATIQNPNPVKNGVQYTISLDEVLRTTFDDGMVIDHPITAYLVVRHDLSGDITDGHVVEVISRLISALYEDDGTCRISKLRRSALKPNND